MNLNIEQIDKKTFLGSIALIAVIVIPLVIWPQRGAYLVDAAKELMTNKLGFIYLSLGISALFFMLYIYLNPIGNIKLGDAEDNPEYSAVSWASMLFCGGIGASILYWGMIEWVFYYQSPLLAQNPAVLKQ